MVWHSRVRGDFIRGYARREDEYLDAGWKLIAGRDKELRALNQRYGYAEPDGSFGIGCKSHVDQDYKREHDDIERRFRGPYDSRLPALYQWCRDHGMSVYECLVLDNIRDEHLKTLVARSETTEDWQLDAIKTRAHLEVQHMAGECRIGEVRRRLDILIQNHHYAARRCRKLLGIKPWDIAAQKAIFDFGREWKEALNRAFGQLEAT